MPTYLNTAQAAEYLGISERGARGLCERGRLGQRIGRNWAISTEELRDYAIMRDCGLRPPIEKRQAED